MFEMKTIEDVCSNVFAGGTPSTKHEEYYDGDIPWIRSGEIDFNIIKSAERNITEAGYKNSSAKKIRRNSVVMAMTGATVAKTAVVEIETTANQSVCAMETNEVVVNYKYLYYCLANDYLKIKSSAQGALTSLNLAMIKQIQIPIPSKEEQIRIVEILDTFTASIANLKEQIKERRKQYEYYRDQLLDLEGKDGVEMKALGEVCQINRGVRVVKKDLEIDGTIPVFQNSLSPLGYYEKSNYPANTTFVISAGAAGDVGFSTIPFWAADDCLCVSCFNSLLNKYVFVFLQSKQVYLKSKVRKGAVPRLSRTFVEQLEIPIVSNQEQIRIVTILDQFEASIANLEAQLKEREKQYEYYRNQLLTFE